jgi:hypothetical protein
MSKRFAVLNHDWPIPHRDLFLECDGHLLAWRIPPGESFALPLPAIEIQHHRLAYLDHEGPVSGERGTVTREDGGALSWITASEDDFEFQLNGHQLNGRFVLRRQAGDHWEWVRA